MYFKRIFPFILQPELTAAWVIVRTWSMMTQPVRFTCPDNTASTNFGGAGAGSMITAYIYRAPQNQL